MIKFDFDKFCYGCTACASICPVSAITLEQNNEGFIVPKVNEDKCIQCNACERICIFLNPLKSKKDLKSSKFNIMSLTNIKELLKSTSGGAFYAIAKHFIENEGYVCGCAWNKEMKAEHIIVNTLSDLEKLQGSKYVQSDIKF